MATDPNTGGFRPVTLPQQFPPMPAVARILSRFDRDQLHGFIAVAIDLADAMDGDPDIEEDSEDRGLDEGEPDMRSYRGYGPGCDIADSDAEHCGREPEDEGGDRFEPLPARYGIDQSKGPLPDIPAILKRGPNPIM